MNLNQLIPSMSSMPYLVRDIVGKVTNAVMNYTDAEIKVIEATNDDSWGPHGKLMEQIADLTFSPITYNEVMSMLWKRVLQDGRTNWRRVYKGCTLLIYLLKHGSHKVLHSIQDRIEELKMLELVEYPVDGNRNTTKNVQIKLAELFKLIEDSDVIENERVKARELKTKYVGVSSKDCRIGGPPLSTSSFHSGKTCPSMDSHISGRWRSTNPGILDKITEVTERVKEFVIDSRNSFKSGSENDSSDDECQQRRNSVHVSEINNGVQQTITPETTASSSSRVLHPASSAEYAAAADDFSEFQQAEEIKEDGFSMLTFATMPSTHATTQSLIDLDKPDTQSATAAAATTSVKLDPLEDLFGEPSSFMAPKAAVVVPPTTAAADAQSSSNKADDAILADIDLMSLNKSFTPTTAKDGSSKCGGGGGEVAASTDNDSMFDCLMQVSHSVGSGATADDDDLFGHSTEVGADNNLLISVAAAPEGHHDVFDQPVVMDFEPDIFGSFLSHPSAAAPAATVESNNAAAAFSPTTENFESTTTTAKVPDTWSDCLDAVKIDLDCLTTSNEEMTQRGRVKTPMGRMKPRQI